MFRPTAAVFVSALAPSVLAGVVRALLDRAVLWRADRSVICLVSAQMSARYGSGRSNVALRTRKCLGGRGRQFAGRALWKDADVAKARANGIGDESALVPYDGPVHHYTSGDGLLQIVSKGQLRVSEASSLNDLAEVKLGWKAIEKWLAANAENSAGANSLKDLLKSSCRDPTHQVFILSGTTAGDDANQWRLYADQGRGYAIELDGAAPLGVVSLEPAKDKSDRQAFGKITEFAIVGPWLRVLYGEQDLAVAMKKAADFAELDVKRIEAIDCAEAREREFEGLREDLTEELATIAHLHKSSGFSGETEVRVVVRFLWFGKHVGYHASRYGIAGHVYLVGAGDIADSPRRVITAPSMANAGSPGFRHPLAITGVRLGPLVKKRNRKTIQGLLGFYGLGGAAVTRSQVPLR